MTTIHFTVHEYVAARAALSELVNMMPAASTAVSLKQLVFETAGDKLAADVHAFIRHAYADATVTIPEGHQMWAVVLTPEQALRLATWLNIYAKSLDKLVVDGEKAGQRAADASHCRTVASFLTARAFFDVSRD